MDEGLKEVMIAYMRDHNTITLATYGEGATWAASVFYANDGFDIYFLSDPKTRHGRSILENPRIAGTIDEDYRDWRKIKGIQLEGRAEVIAGRVEKAKALAIYLRKFPFVAEFFSSPSKISLSVFTKATSTVFYKIVPSRLFYLDNEKGFGHREELVVRMLD